MLELGSSVVHVVVVAESEGDCFSEGAHIDGAGYGPSGGEWRNGLARSVLGRA